MPCISVVAHGICGAGWAYVVPAGHPSRVPMPCTLLVHTAYGEDLCRATARAHGICYDEAHGK